MFRAIFSCLVIAVAVVAAPSTRAQSERPARRDVSTHKEYGTHFQTSDRCVACHNGISTPAGEDISIGVNWRTSMMANAGRDP